MGIGQYIKTTLQYRMQQALGLPQHLFELEERVKTLEADVAVLKGQTARTERGVFYLCPGNPVDQLEQELARLEEIFALGYDGPSAWFGTLVGPPEFIKISNPLYRNGN